MAITELLPLYDLIAKCNRCGFCQAGCPVYRVTGSEHSLARGRWAVARGLVLGEIELTPDAIHALDDCSRTRLRQPAQQARRERFLDLAPQNFFAVHHGRTRVHAPGER